MLTFLAIGKNMIDQEATSPANYRLRERLGFRMSRLAKTMQWRLEQDLSRFGMTRLKWCVLSAVALEGVTAPSDLAYHIGIARPAISRLLKAMENEGLIARDIATDDGRSHQISVTPEGMKQIDVCWPHVQENHNHFMSKLTQDQNRILFAALDALARGESAMLDDL